MAIECVGGVCIIIWEGGSLPGGGIWRVLWVFWDLVALYIYLQVGIYIYTYVCVFCIHLIKRGAPTCRYRGRSVLDGSGKPYLALSDAVLLGLGASGLFLTASSIFQLIFFSIY